MKRRSLGALAATGILAAAVAAPVSAQGPEVTVAEGDPIVIAAYGPITGALASIGLDWMIAADVAKDDHGGTILGHPIEIQRIDGGCSSDGGATAANLIVSNPDVVGVLGGTCSDEVAAGIKTIHDAGLTAISPSATRDSFTLPGREPEFDAFMRVAFSDRFQGPEVAKFVFSVLGMDRVATIHDGSIYSDGLVRTFSEAFVALGGEITRAEVITAQLTTDMGPALTAIAPTEPQAIYFPIFEREGGFMLQQVRAIEGLEDVQLVGSDGLFSVTFLDVAGPDVEGMFVSAGDQRRYQAGYADMVAKYLEKEGLEAPLSAFHPHGYDAANVMFNAIEDVAIDNGDGSHTINLAALRERLKSTTDHPGLTGNLTCDEFGDCGTPLVAVYEIGPEQVEDRAWPPTAVWPPIE